MSKKSAVKPKGLALNPSFVKVYTDASGNNWYTLVNITDIGSIRSVAAERANRFIGMHLSQFELKKLTRAQNEAFRTGEIMKAAAIGHEIEYRNEFLTEENSIFDLVHIYYLLEDEDPNKPEEWALRKKHEIWAHDLAAHAFFLRIGLTLTKRFSSLSEDASLKYLLEIKATAERIYRYISRPWEQ